MITNNQEHIVRAINIHDFLGKELPQKEYIVNPILPKQGLMMVYARRGIGKTYVALQLAYAIASSTNLFNDKWKIHKQYKVLYIDGEMPANTMQERLAGIVCSSKEVENYDNFKLITPDMQPYGIMPNLATEEGQAQIESFVQDSDVIIIDNLSTLCRGGKENEADSWKLIQEWALRLRTQGKSIIFVHHAGKNDQQRGTSKKEDILDTVISLKRPENYTTKEGARFEVHYEKSRGFSGDDANPFQVRLEINEKQEALWYIEDLEDVKLKRVIELSKDGLTQRDIAKELSIGLGSVNRMVKSAKEEGKL